MDKINLEGIKAIIFDLGGVILNINYQLAEQAFEKLGIENFAELFSQASQSKLFDRLEKGVISPAEFRKELCSLSKKNLTDDQIDKAWNAMLLDLPPERIELLKKLKEHYKIYLLSNTNKIHIDQFSCRTISREKLESLFDKVYFSSEIGMRKPDSEIFEHVLKENGLKPSETLFIDDSIQHIEGAEKVEIRAVLLEKGTTINKLFKS